MMRLLSRYCAVMLAVPVALTAGCAGLEHESGGSGDPAPGNTGVHVGTDLIPDQDTAPAGLTVTASAANKAETSSILPETLTSEELALLQSTLAGLLGGSAGSNTDGSIFDPRDLGLSRRDLALAALTLLEDQDILTDEQVFVVRVTRAYLERDADALLQLILESLLGAVDADTGTIL